MKSYVLVMGDFVKTGGMDRANYALADYLARQGAELHLVAHRVATTLLNYPNVQWHRVPKIANSDFLGGFLLNWVGQTWARRITAQGGRVLVNGGNCQWSDVNWVHYVHAAYKPTSRVSVLRQVKTVIAHYCFLQSEKRTLRKAKIVLANSARTQHDLVNSGLASPSVIHPVCYGIDPSIFYPVTPNAQRALRQQLGWALDRLVVVFIGALGDRRKGFDTVFEAWQQLCTDPTWNADLVVIGQGAELAQWQQRSHQVGLSDRIQFLGFRQDVPDLLQASDCLVAPTRYEAYGLGVHEALCCGIPAIVSANAGVAEQYPEELKELLLSDPNNVNNLVNRFQHWKRNRQVYRKIIIDMLCQKMRSHTWDGMAKAIIEAIA
ncbi:glycosyltransferase family 4 protein [Myxacorys almedinensis]|uniref:Glycosyltransferase n=1 Tax=Myxacorys almedinensis A TaxID=2690445 RepID=A0A8J7Z124_9CYAN|nr:glycosyltransferase family 4 protein [Myxacorys almedinensis]NDJ16216.1 glycosyltransferase [Myxacorys almedinensis A]